MYKLSQIEKTFYYYYYYTNHFSIVIMVITVNCDRNCNFNICLQTISGYSMRLCLFRVRGLF